MKDLSKFILSNISKKNLSDLLINYKIKIEKDSLYNAGKLYIFYFNQQLYGIFKILYVDNNYYYFNNKPYRNAKYFIGKEYNYNIENYILKPENNKKIIYTFLDEVKNKKEILVKLKKKDNFSFVAVSSKKSKELIYYNKQDNFNKILEVLDKIQNIIISNTNINSLKKYGYFLWNNLFDKNMKSIINSSDIVNYFSNYEINLDYVFTGEYFLNQKKIINIYNQQAKPNNKKNNIAIVMPLYKRDDNMKNEAEIVSSSINQNKKYKLTKFYYNLKKIDFENILKDYKFVHFIGHGFFNKNKKGIYIGDELLFTNQDFKKINDFPEILIISSCRALEVKTIEHLFTGGMKYFLHSFFDIFSKTGDIFYKNLYWNLLNRKISIGRAIKISKNKIFKINTNNFNLYCSGEINYRL